MAVTKEQTKPKLRNGDGTTTAISALGTTIDVSFTLTREDYRALQNKCDTNSVHINDRMRELVAIEIA